MNVEDFMLKYPNIIDYKESILNPYEDQFESAIYRKKEFYDNRLSKYEEKVQGSVELAHQQNMARFMSSYTMYNRILVFHEMGTGKTGVSIRVAEKFLEDKLRGETAIQKTLVLLKGKPLIDNYINELVHVSTSGKYIPENYQDLTEIEKKVRIKKLISKFYEFDTFEVFAKRIKTLQPIHIQRLYSNRFIVIDEVHNIKQQSDSGIDVYGNLHRFLHSVQNCKIMLMSATPMTDRPEEIAYTLNLLLDQDHQLPVGIEFRNRYIRDNTLTYTGVKEITEAARGIVSYLRVPVSDVKKKYIGKSIGDLRNFKVDISEMSGFQGKIYDRAYTSDTKSAPEVEDISEVDSEEVEDKKSSGIYQKSRQASLFVFPDGSIGSEGFGKYITEKKIKIREHKKDKVLSVFESNIELRDAILRQSKDATLENIAKYSVKYNKIITNILKNRDHNTFIYCDSVTGGGAIVLSKLLDMVGFEKATGEETTPGLRYAIITNRTSTTRQIRKLIERFNRKDNMNGQYIQVVIGSRVISEGFSLKNIQDIHVLTPHWNYSKLDQAIARGLRLFSHQALIESGQDVEVKIYQYVAVYNDIKRSIDYIMYLLSENKDYIIKSIERVLRETAFDCALNYNRNYSSGNDYLRVCEYQKCEYKCIGQDPEDLDSLDTSTYNILYSRSEQDKKIQQMLVYFTKNDTITIQDDIVAIQALNYMIDSNILVNGDKFLKKYGNTYFLSSVPTRTGQLFEAEYQTQNIEFSVDTISSYLSKNLITIIPNIIDRMSNAKNSRQILELFQQLPLSVRVKFLEVLILYPNAKTIIRDTLLEHYKGSINKIGNTLVLSLDKDHPRCLVGNVWSDCDEKINQQADEDKKALENTLINNPYGYYGIIDKNGKFFIRDVTTEEKKWSENKKIRTKGVGCGTGFLDKFMLIKLCVILGAEPEQELPDSKKSSVIDKIKSDGKKYNKLLSVYAEKDILDMNLDSLKLLYYWTYESKAGKNDLCEIIKSKFISKNLILRE